MTSTIPAVVENHLGAIQYNEDGKLLLASSNLTGRYYNGSLWCFQTVEDAPSVEKCLTGIDVSSGICDLVCLDKNNVALGLDSGGLEIYKLENDPASFNWIFGVCEHDDFISSLSLNSDRSNLVTAGADKCLKIWDIETWATTSTYRPIHGGIIWQVSCSSEDPQMLVTCGQDGKILLFDLRLPKPALIIETSPLKGEPTAVNWKPGSNCFAVGDDSGLVAVKDIRNHISLCSWEAHKRCIHRIQFCSSHPWIATCSDDTDVCITNLENENPVVLYTSDDHNDFVRGLAWTSEDELVSCAWDKKVLKHSFKMS